MDQWCALVNTAMYLQIPEKVQNLLTKLAAVSVKRRTLLYEVVYSIFVVEMGRFNYLWFI
jgi:hypothetical protein